MLSKEFLDTIEKALERDLQKILSKPELTSTDWDGVKKAVCIAGMIADYTNGEPMMTDADTNSYGYMGYHGYSNGDSYGRGRSPVTGRYISRGTMDGYSGHSIEDRMIMALEQQMDAAKSDYERSLIEKEIQRIRRGDR